MGWWSTEVMGGDTPLDFEGDMLHLCGIDYGRFQEFDEDHSKFRTEIESAVDALVDYCEDVRFGEDVQIAFQVLGVIILSAGANLPADIKLQIEEAIIGDTWSIDDEDRRAHMTSFHQQVASYDGTPTQLNHNRLFEKMEAALG